MSTTSRDRSPAVGLATLALVATTALTSCGGGDSKADASSEPTTSDSVSVSPSTSPSGSPSPSASSSSAVAPATGKQIDTSYFTVRAPKHYQVHVQGKDFSYAISGAADIGIGIIAESGDTPTLDQLARRIRSQVDSLKKAPLGRTTTIDGEPAYLLVASEPYHTSSEVGLYRDSHFIHLTIDSYDGRAHNLKLLRSMLATWQWK